MFKSKNFCHVASNNRNQVKVGVFVYRTTDNLAAVSASGYFNERIIDINLHDLIIHEQIDAADNTKVQRNILSVTERTLENVGTTVLKSKWEVDIEQYIEDTFVKKDGSSIMTGPLKIRATESFKCAIAPYWEGVGFFKLNDNDSVTLIASIEESIGFVPATNNELNLGSNIKKWKTAYLSNVNNGHDIAVPVTASADTLALKSQVDDAANSGEQLYTTGVWYAKMYAATTPPAEAEVEGRNYADFSQVDGENNPIIVVYTYTSGAWTLTETITPPANHNGYMTITSKIWDIAEQAGQQGGQVLWSHNQKTFTPYPRIVSFDGANITNSTITTSTFSGSATLSGESTVAMPATPSGSQIVNVDYVTDHADPLKYATNCITEIPQDIILELSAGTLTLKAGSKCYLKTDTTTPSVEVASDLTTTQATDGTYFAIYDGSALTTVLTTTYDYSSLPDTYSLPLALITVSGGVISRIDQVFNGFGYIGTSKFVLPGVKALAPNGLNTDGSCNNIKFTNQSVYVNTDSGTNKRVFGVELDASGNIIGYELAQETHVYVGLLSDRPLTVGDTSGYIYYATDKNKWYSTSGSTTANWTDEYIVLFGKYQVTSSSISYFSTKNVFRALDYNDKEYIAHQAMPSNKYIDLTLDASGNAYTAPADGYFTLTKASNAANQNIQMVNDGNGMRNFVTSASSGSYIGTFMPVKKGGNVRITYTTGGSTVTFRFVYANGAL